MLVKGGTRVLFYAFPHVRCEVVVAPLASAEAHETEGRGEETAIMEVIDGGEQFFAGKIARHTEHHDRARSSDEGEATVARVAQGVAGCSFVLPHCGPLCRDMCVSHPCPRTQERARGHEASRFTWWTQRRPGLPRGVPPTRSRTFRRPRAREPRRHRRDRRQRS